MHKASRCGEVEGMRNESNQTEKKMSKEIDDVRRMEA